MKTGKTILNVTRPSPTLMLLSFSVAAVPLAFTIQAFVTGFAAADASGEPLDECVTAASLILLGITVALGGICHRALIRALQLQGVAISRLAERLLEQRSIPAPVKLIEPEVQSLESTSESQTQALGTRDPEYPAKLGHRTFRIIIASDLMRVIHNYISDFLAKFGQDMEAGGLWIGDYMEDPKSREVTFTIRGFIDSGPKADFSPGSILFDHAYQLNALRLIQIEHPSAANLGTIHRHGGTFDCCSAGDAITDAEAVKAAETKALVFGIITINNRQQKPSSLVYKDLKIDFYLMAAETSYEYLPMRPIVADLPLLEISKAFEQLAATRGAEIALDLAVLRSIPGIGKRSLRSVTEQDGGGSLLTAAFAESQDRVHVWTKPDGALQVGFETGGKVRLVPGPWEQAEVGRHVWLSHVALAARAEATAEVRDNHSGRHYGNLLHDKNRLVVEVRAMQERYGDRATLCRKGDVLYWAYDVHESGRVFPIRIEYPERYPVEPPRIISVKQLPSSPHQLSDNEICWINHYSQFSEWNPARDTAAVCIAPATRWFACLLIYLSGGDWPKGAEY